MGETPKVGLGVIIIKDGKILVGKRIGAHAQKYSIPGGKLEKGETFERSAAREVKEETNLDIINPKVIAMTNNLETFEQEGLHDVSVILLADSFSGELKLMEPNKCAEWLWVDPKELPEPHFDASKKGVACFLEKTHYLG